MDSKGIKTFDLNLDIPARERWVPIFNSYPKEKLQELATFAKRLLEPYSPYLSIASGALSLVPTSNIMYYGELICIAELCGLDLIELILLQLIYEANAACSTIIWQDSEGKPHYFRTMDWELPYLKQWTIKVRYIKKGKCVSEGVTWLGLVGLFTVTSVTHGYSIAVNYRRTKLSLGIQDMIASLMRVISMSYPVAYLVRNSVNSELEYNELLKELETSSLISPCYLTVYNHEDVTKSCIITRDTNGYVRREYDNYLIQTNCDWNHYIRKSNELLDIMLSVQRYDVARKILSGKPTDGRAFLVSPILNDITIYSCIDNTITIY